MCMVTHFLRGKLIHGNTDTDIPSRGLPRLHPGEEGRISPCMITSTVPIRLGFIVL